MSDTYLRLIPTDPSFIPGSDVQNDLKRYLALLYSDEQISLITNDNIEFIDQGENFESVYCNICGKMIDTGDWQDAMDDAYQKQFDDLGYTTPCCKSLTTLNDLVYTMPAGFARFVIEVFNPGEEISREDLSKLEKIVGIPLRIIRAHY